MLSDEQKKSIEEIAERLKISDREKQSLERISERLGTIPEIGSVPDKDIMERKVAVKVVTEKPSGKFIGVFGTYRDYFSFVHSSFMFANEFEERYDVWDCDISIDIRVQAVEEWFEVAVDASH